MAMRSIVDLWPHDIGERDPAEERTRTPVAILREQGALLAEKTRGALGGEVRFDESGAVRFVYSLWIVPAAAPHCEYLLVRMMHGATTWPCDVFVGRELFQELEAMCEGRNGQSPADVPERDAS